MNLVTLYRKTLEKLQVVAAGEPAAAEDVQLVADKYVSVWNQLKTRGLVSWTVTGAVPDEATESMIKALAFACSGEFDENPEEYAAEGAIGIKPPSIAEQDLRQLHARDYVSTPAQSEYF